MLIYSAMLMTAMNRLDFQDHGFVTFYFAWLLVQAVSFGGAALISQDSVSRLYQQPITNWSIVAWRLIPGMTATAVLYLASTILLNGIFHLGWPLAGPAIFLACSYPIFQAGMWLGEKCGRAGHTDEHRGGNTGTLAAGPSRGLVHRTDAVVDRSHAE